MSEHFVVSARKYRPLKFEDVVGQEGVTITLKNAIKSGQLGHAYLFCGPRGVGKTTCARILAREVNNFTADKSGDITTSFNIYELDAASNNSVEDIRNLVDQVRFPPQYGKYKVYIIDEVHMLSPSAFNAFLKTLEEPPPYAIFILATTEKHKILPTILSRCQIYDFSRITINDIVEHLKGICKTEGIDADENALRVIAQKADGALRDALSMLDRLVDHNTRSLTYDSVLTNLNILDYDYYFKFSDFFRLKEHAAVLLLFDEILRKGFDGNDFISGLGEHFRNLMVSRNEKTVSLLEVSGAIKEKYLQQAQAVNSSFLLNALNLANQCEVNYKTSNNKRLHVELTLMKICHLNSLLEINSASPADASLKKNPVNKNSYETAASTETTKAQVAEPKISHKIEIEKPAAEQKNEVSASVTNPPVPLEKKSAATAIDVVGSFRLSDLKIEDEPPKKEVKKKIAENIELDPLKIEQAWKEYAQLMTQQKRVSLENLMMVTKPAVEGSVITVILQSRLQKELFDNERSRLVEFIEKKLNVSGISLIAVVDKAGAPPPVKPFTAEEKFKKMAEKNPALLTLRDKLDLRLEH